MDQEGRTNPCKTTNSLVRYAGFRC